MKEKLIRAALQARKFAYAPYSNFKVGAALLAADGRIFTGCNIENAALGPTNCAERTAFFKAVSEGVRDFAAIAIVGADSGKETPEESCPPCGVCRQVMVEFCSSDFEVILAVDENHYQTYTLKEIMPLAFKKERLNR